MTTTTLKISPTESVTIRKSEPEVLELEATYGPEGSGPPKHYHPSQDEHFEILAGRVRVRVDADERDLVKGEKIDVPRGAVHRMWNPTEEPARVKWETRPAGRTEEFFRAIDSLHREGKVGRNGMSGPLAFAALLTEYGDTFRLAAKPELVIRGALAVLAPLGRARGYVRKRD